MKIVCSLVLLFLGLKSYASTLTLTNRDSSKTVVHDISSVSLTTSGVAIFSAKNAPMCLVTESFLKASNTSGLQLMKELVSKSNNYFVYCRDERDNSLSPFLQKLREKFYCLR